MFIVGMLIDLVLSKWGDASYAIGWLVGVCSALWWSKYVIDWLNQDKQQWIDDACEWLRENIYHKVYECGDRLGFPTAEFLKEFRKAMKGGNDENETNVHSNAD